MEGDRPGNFNALGAPAQGSLEDRKAHEKLSVENWRVRELIRMDVPTEDAIKMARDKTVDIGRCREIIAKGCPPALLLGIVL